MKSPTDWSGWSGRIRWGLLIERDVVDGPLLCHPPQGRHGAGDPPLEVLIRQRR